MELQAEAEETLKAQQELRKLLVANEANKELKEKQRLEDQALDRKYAREYAAKLDHEEQVISPSPLLQGMHRQCLLVFFLVFAGTTFT